MPTTLDYLNFLIEEIGAQNVDGSLAHSPDEILTMAKTAKEHVNILLEKRRLEGFDASYQRARSEKGES